MCFSFLSLIYLAVNFDLLAVFCLSLFGLVHEVLWIDFYSVPLRIFHLRDKNLAIAVCSV